MPYHWEGWTFPNLKRCWWRSVPRLYFITPHWYQVLLKPIIGSCRQKKKAHIKKQAKRLISLLCWHSHLILFITYCCIRDIDLTDALYEFGLVSNSLDLFAHAQEREPQSKSQAEGFHARSLLPLACSTPIPILESHMFTSPSPLLGFTQIYLVRTLSFLLLIVNHYSRYKHHSFIKLYNCSYQKLNEIPALSFPGSTLVHYSSFGNLVKCFRLGETKIKHSSNTSWMAGFLPPLLKVFRTSYILLYIILVLRNFFLHFLISGRRTALFNHSSYFVFKTTTITFLSSYFVKVPPSLQFVAWSVTFPYSVQAGF